MNEVLSILVQSLRALRRSPGFAVSALLILTLGIGANTAIFSIVNAVLLRPLPFANPDSVVTIFHVPPPQSFPGVKTFAVSAANYLDWRQQGSVFSGMAVIGGHSFRLGGGERPLAVRAIRTEPDFFSVLSVKPAYGRLFTTAECLPGRDRVIVLSDGFAARQFGAAARAVGQVLQLDGAQYRVIGVMPGEFHLRSWFPLSTEAWSPLAWTARDAAIRGDHNYLVIARMKHGVSLQEAQTQMNVVSERLARDYPEQDKGWGAVVTSVRDRVVGEIRPALLMLLGAVGFVLLIACGNTANLVLARTLSRRKELAIRAALGGTRRETLRPVMVETTLLAIAGGGLGLLLAGSGQTLVVRALSEQMPQATTIRMDGRVLLFTLIASVVTGLLAGLIGCWRVSLGDLNASLKQGLGKGDVSPAGQGTRSALVICEVALSLILLVGAGLMVRSLWSLQSVDPGFQPAQVMTMAVPLAKDQSFYNELLPRIRQLPGVASAGAVDNLPLDGGGPKQPITVEGRTAEVFALQPNVEVRMATPGYLSTLRIALRAGRDFNEFDTTGKRPVVLISRRMAEQFWPNEDAIGKRLRISFTPEVVREVVGIVDDIKERGLSVMEPVAMLYEPLARDEQGGVSLVVRGDRDALSLSPEIRRILHDLNPDLPWGEARTMNEVVAQSLSQQRYSAWLFVALAGLAFLMAAVGIYSVLAFSVRSRVTEISIRMALGAQISDVLRLVILEGMRPVVIGIFAGALGAWALGGFLSRLLYGVSPSDPSTFAGVTTLLAVVALLACLLPAYQAARVVPVKALRNE